MFPKLPSVSEMAVGVSAGMPHVLPPIHSVPIAWTFAVTMIPGSDEQAGVAWNPRRVAADATDACAFIVATDTPFPGETFPQDQRGVVWLEAYVGNATVNPAADNLQKACRWSVVSNGQILPGYGRQMPGGQSYRAQVVAGSTIMEPGGLPGRMPCPIHLRSGDQLGVVLSTKNVSAGLDVDWYVIARGWRWTEPGR